MRWTNDVYNKIISTCRKILAIKQNQNFYILIINGYRLQSLSTKSRKEKRELRKQLSSLSESITKTEKATEEVQNELLLLKEALKKSERQLWEELLSLKESINTQLVRQQQTLAIISNQLNTWPFTGDDYAVLLKFVIFRTTTVYLYSFRKMSFLILTTGLKNFFSHWW